MPITEVQVGQEIQHKNGSDWVVLEVDQETETVYCQKLGEDQTNWLRFDEIFLVSESNSSFKGCEGLTSSSDVEKLETALSLPTNIDSKVQNFTCSFNFVLKNKPETGASQTNFIKQQDITLYNLRDHVVGKGLAFSPYAYKGNYRKSENALPTRLLVLDIDANWSLEAFMNHPLVKDECCFIYTSPSDKPDGIRKFRAVYILPQELDPELHKFATDEMIRELDADPNCWDNARTFFGNDKAIVPLFEPTRSTSQKFLNLAVELAEGRIKAAQEEIARRNQRKIEAQERREKAEVKNHQFQEVFGDHEGWTWRSFYNEVIMPEFESLDLLSQIELAETNSNTKLSFNFKQESPGVYRGNSPWSTTNKSGKTLKVSLKDGWTCFASQEPDGSGFLGGGGLKFLMLVWEDEFPLYGEKWKNFANKLAESLGIAVPIDIDKKDNYYYYKETLLADSDYLKTDPELAGQHFALLMNWSYQNYPKKYDRRQLELLAKKAIKWLFRDSQEALEQALESFKDESTNEELIKPEQASEVPLIEKFKQNGGKQQQTFDWDQAYTVIERLVRDSADELEVIKTLNLITEQHSFHYQKLLNFYKASKLQFESQIETEQLKDQTERYAEILKKSNLTDPYEIFHPKLAQSFANTARYLKIDKEFLISPFLVFAAGCIGKKMKACYKGQSVVPRRWNVSIARSKSGKSRGENFVAAPLKEVSNKLQSLLLQYEEQYRALQVAYKSMPVDERRATNGSETDPNNWADFYNFLCKLDLIVQDFTLEALFDVLESRNSIKGIPHNYSEIPGLDQIAQTIHEAGVIVTPDEIKGLMKSMNQYKGGGGNDKERMLTLRTQDDWSTRRKNGLGGQKIKDAFVSVSGGTQPDNIDELFNLKDGSGQLSRWNFRTGMIKPKGDFEEEFVLSDSLQEFLDYIYSFLLNNKFEGMGMPNVVYSDEAIKLMEEYARYFDRLGYTDTDSTDKTAVGRIEEWFEGAFMLLQESVSILHGIDCAMKDYCKESYTLTVISEETVKRAFELVKTDAKNFVQLMLRQSSNPEVLDQEYIEKVADLAISHLYPKMGKIKIPASQRKDRIAACVLYKDPKYRMGRHQTAEFYKPFLEAACELHPDLLKMDKTGIVKA